VAIRLFGETDAQIDHATQRARQVRDRLMKAFPDHEITLVKLPYSDLQSQVLAGSVAAKPLNGAADAAVAEYLIRKRT
jgi:hypothetical protein